MGCGVGPVFLGPDWLSSFVVAVVTVQRSSVQRTVLRPKKVVRALSYLLLRASHTFPQAYVGSGMVSRVLLPSSLSSCRNSGEGEW